VKHSPGALAEALAESLAEAAVLLANRETEAEKIGAALADVLNRLGKAGRVLASEGIGAILIGVFEQKVGSKGAEVLKKAAAEALGKDRRLAESIRTAIPADAIEVLMNLAHELRIAGDSATLRLALDRLERLDDSDWRRLMDLTETVPDGVLLTGCWSTADAGANSRIEGCERAGAHVIRIAGLSEEDVAKWLADAGVNRSLLGTVMRHTHGYPLWVDAAITHLRDHEELSDLPIDGQIQSINRQAYNALQRDDQRAVSLLAAFADPPIAERVPDYLGMDAPSWLAAQGRLIYARVFGAEVGGQPWFHELRRRHLWEEVISKGQRSEAASQALMEIADASKAPGASRSICVGAARLAPAAERLLSEDNELAFFVTCGAEEIAIAAALIELSEPNPSDGTLGPVNAQMLAMHARAEFGAEADLVPAIRRLADANLIVLVENDRAAVAIRIWRSWPATLVAVGRAAAELGRYPLQNAASMTFEVAIRPRLGTFREGICGIGHLDARSMLEARRAMPDIDSQGTRIMRRGPPAILVEAQHGRLPVYAMAAYMNVSELDSASIAEGEIEGNFEYPIRIVSVFRCPSEAVPSRRFIRAAERIIGKTLGTSHSSSIFIPAAVSEQSLEEAITSQGTTCELVRGLCTPLERLAMGLAQPMGYLYASDSGSFVAEVSGMSGALRTSMPATPWGPYSRFQLARQAGLAADCQIDRITFRSYPGPSNDGTLAVLVDLHKRVAAFNESQERKSVALEPSTLEPLLAEAELRVRQDTSALEAVMARDASPSPPQIGRSIYLLLWRQSLDDRAMFDEYLMGSVAMVPTDDEPRVRYKILSERLDHSPWREDGPVELFRAQFGLRDTDLARGSFLESTSRSIIADLLGYLQTEIELPEETELRRNKLRTQAHGHAL
jgi:hypothetical protein